MKYPKRELIAASYKELPNGQWFKPVGNGFFRFIYIETEDVFNIGFFFYSRSKEIVCWNASNYDEKEDLSRFISDFETGSFKQIYYDAMDFGNFHALTPKEDRDLMFDEIGL